MFSRFLDWLLLFLETMDSAKITAYIKQMDHYDNQERYMGLSDLTRELEKDDPIPPELERKICTAVLTRLDDDSNDVQSISVKTLGALLKKVESDQICDIR